MKIYYRLDINTNSSKQSYKFVTKLLGKNPSETKSKINKNQEFNVWSLEEVSLEGDEYIDYFSEFLMLLEGKYKGLEELGITRNDISFWLLYEYDEQCNLEFPAEKLEKIGKEGISICISCWQKRELIEIKNT
jgi:hypothetical protein